MYPAEKPRVSLMTASRPSADERTASLSILKLPEIECHQVSNQFPEVAWSVLVKALEKTKAHWRGNRVRRTRASEQPPSRWRGGRGAAMARSSRRTLNFTFRIRGFSPLSNCATTPEQVHYQKNHRYY